MIEDLEFRAWDNFNGEYFYSERMGLPAFFTHCEQAIAGDNGIIVERCTGLEDRNGVKIFEGDILRWTRGEVAQVVWMAGDACFDTKPVLNGLEHASHYDVIGNIHENPELFK